MPASPTTSEPVLPADSGRTCCNPLRLSLCRSDFIGFWLDENLNHPEASAATNKSLVKSAGITCTSIWLSLLFTNANDDFSKGTAIKVVICCTSLIEWIDRVLGFGEAPSQVAPADESRRVRSAFHFIDDPGAMRMKLINQAREIPGSARLLATYAWEWKSQSNPTLVDSDLGGILSQRTCVPGLRFRWLPNDPDKKADFLLGRGSFASPAVLNFGQMPVRANCQHWRQMLADDGMPMLTQVRELLTR